MNKEKECSNVVCEIKKKWYKSKVIIINTLTSIISIIALFAEEIKSLISDNIEYLKGSGLEVKYILIILTLLCVINVFLKVRKIKKDNNND